MTDAERAELDRRIAAFSQPRGLGDMVADGLASVGITKERVQAVASAVGIGDCGCGKRQAALNAIGEKLGLPAGRDEAS